MFLLGGFLGAIIAILIQTFFVSFGIKATILASMLAYVSFLAGAGLVTYENNNKDNKDDENKND